jgi:hypothetical protein
LLPIPVLAALAALLLAPAGPSVAHAVTRSHRPIVALNASQSNNWSGYNQGTIEKGGTTFHSIAGDWVVPTATQHKAGEAEYSSTWIGIGGGCVDADCLVTDNTLIQAGTESDVDASGAATYEAWWELIPAPGVTITDFPVKAGDSVHFEINETLPAVWTFSAKNNTTGKTWTMTVPYTSTYLTAEWITETPVVVDGSGNVTIGPLPKLSTVRTDTAKVNGANARLVNAEQVQLVDANNKPLATPSAPDAQRDGFNLCTYASSCAAP